MPVILKSKAFGAAALLALIGGAIAVALLVFGSNSVTAAADTSLPASKATIAIDNLIDLSAQAAKSGTTTSLDDTGWTDVLKTQIKTSNQKDLMFDAAFQCGLVTDTTVSSKNATLSTATARANIAVRILVDPHDPVVPGDLAQPVNDLDIDPDTGFTHSPGIVYCDRSQTLSASFGGSGCTADLTNGGLVTCQNPETLELILRTLNANSFNFAKPDVSSGVHRIVVQARAQAKGIVNQSTTPADTVGTMAGAEAFLGAGSLFVESVRLINQNVDGVNTIDLG
jgi:hypothetical protein